MSEKLEKLKSEPGYKSGEPHDERRPQNHQKSAELDCGDSGSYQSRPCGNGSG